ncbi:MAG: nucleoside monophosphate kinase [Candidatus Doudnabacteria bacterium]|nr:nucleoside monophosphate kinase [Candidatus Doudnabacteria bacterium]
MKIPDAVFFIGRSGAGKGTQAQLLAERLNFFYWEMGAILRAEIAKSSPIGQEIGALVAKGLFLDDHHMFKVIAAHIHEIPKDKPIIFDGVPRRMSQAPYVIGLLHGMGRKDLTTFFLDVPREDSVARLLARKRSDDTEEVINRRLDQFDLETAPVLDFLQEMTKFYRIDGRPTIPDVAASINAILKQ